MSDPTREALATVRQYRPGIGMGQPPMIEDPYGGWVVLRDVETVLAALSTPPPSCTFPGCSCDGTMPAIPTDPTPPPSLDVERLRAAIEAELELVPRRKRPQFDAGAAAAYHFVLSLLPAPPE